MLKKIMKKLKNLIITTALILSLASCSNNSKKDNKQSETIHQVSLLQGLMLGDYYGSISVKELKQMGDIGIGTFDKLNGELIMTDGVVYRAKGDGTVEVVNDSEVIPFANVTVFDKDESIDLNNVKNLDSLLTILNKKVNDYNSNQYCMVKISGTFNKMNVRSELAQKEPYKPLVDVLKTDQTFFDYEKINGTVVALYMPPYMNTINTTGWHLHFVSEDKTKGGHLLNLEIDKATLSLDYTSDFQMHLPDGEFFKSLDLTVDQDDDIKEVEQGQ